MALRMCVDEVGSNVLMHAYVQEPPEPGAEPRAGRMRVELWVPAADAPAETLVALRVIDAGRAFDPHDAPIARMEDDVEERALGGLGWFFVREMTDRIDYQRTAHPCNVSTMWRVLGRRELEA
jgi:serine/threonine-protein kinase RsbW/sigma-B regulation protein RsbU (phosphoserine phosphatase)